MGAQDYAHYPRNDAVLVSVDGKLVPRDEASVSIFDAGFVLGDGVWEGLRLHRGRLAFAGRHLDRLFEGARAIDLDISLSAEELEEHIWRVLDANGMQDGVHVRLMVTRGRKSAINQDPRNATGRPTVVIVAEYKMPDPQTQKRGMTLFTSAIRAMGPDTLDTRINSHSRLGLILALNHAIKAGADEALMLDPHGFVATCNSTNFFFVRAGRVMTSTGRYGFNGITRAHVIELCEHHAVPITKGDFTLVDLYSADEAFVTGTFGGLTPVRMIDGRLIGDGTGAGPLTRSLQAHYAALMDRC